MSPLRVAVGGFAALVATLVVVLALRTAADLRELPSSLDAAALARASGESLGVQVLDRTGTPLNVTLTNAWNVHDVAAVHEIPRFMREAMIAAEDKRFYDHDGVDWLARAAALAANVRNLAAVRGASTITEQVVRMLHPRPRTVWSRWLEGWEARRLERAFGKDEILEFYLNQVPYASNRRGVRQAANFYFARDLGTLSKKEMLALAVLVRAPTRLDLQRGADASAGAMERLASALVERGVLDERERDVVLAEEFVLERPRLAVNAPHFVQHVRATVDQSRPSLQVTTTLDARLQAKVQGMLDERLRYLRGQNVRNGAVLAVDHTTGEVLAWVNGNGGGDAGPATHIDAVLMPRQPGSALKPFLYALALERGWTAAEVIEDAPLVESTSGGLHSYQNYSRRFYGRVTLRDALGNSLNIPAVRTLQYVGTEAFLARLRELGFAHIENHPDYYGDGIALGSGAVTLYELVQAYAALANRGIARPLRTQLYDDGRLPARRVFTPEAASLVADILADPNARTLEFGRDGVLAMPLQTAAKTGTSSDYRDAWAIAFNYRYVVGAWMGNVDNTPTDGVTGSIGPSLLVRGVLTELTRTERTRPLYLSPKLARHEVCVPVPPKNGPGECFKRAEWLLPGTQPEDAPSAAARHAETAAGNPIRLRQPTPGLQLAYDPRLPAESQAFEFQLDGVEPGDSVRWLIDGESVGGVGARYRWPVERGAHRVAVEVARAGGAVVELPEVAFVVK